MSEKLQKVLAEAGRGSRREIEQLIAQGVVSVNGVVAKLGDRVERSQSPVIRIHGHVVPIKNDQAAICRVLLYYKPEGEMCTRRDPQGRATVFDRLPKIQQARWIAVGRLDINTSGLLLFTTDGELANRLMHPKHALEREYAVRIFGEVSDLQLRQLAKGVQLEDGPASFKTIRRQGGEGINQWYNVVLTEGRNREVRRLWEAVGLQVSRLIRVRFGNLTLSPKLPRGGWQELPLEQVNYLRELVGLAKEQQTKLAVDKRSIRGVKTQQIRRAVKRHQGREDGNHRSSPKPRRRD